MVRRCNAVNVRTYVDVVINHMTGIHRVNIGTGKSIAFPTNRLYPAVPYNDTHFNSPVCGIGNYNDPKEVRNCELVGLRDLNHTHPYVRAKTIEFLNHLIDLGVAGFRVDAAKHMWPQNLKDIYEELKSLNTAFGFEEGAQPYIVQEVIDLGGEGISRQEYTPLGAITEFRHSADIGNVFRGYKPMGYMNSWGRGWGFVESEDALVFVDNHDNQRGHGGGGTSVLMYRDGKRYRMATAWTLAHPYATVRIMSSFAFPQGENDLGPPQDADGNLVSPVINENGTCSGGWVCEHRWPTTMNMVSFRNIAIGEPFNNWFSNGYNQVSFSRGKKAFIAFNNEFSDFSRVLQTNLPEGVYCDIMSGQRLGSTCTGLRVRVNDKGYAYVFLPATSTEGVIAIHVGPLSKLL